MEDRDYMDLLELQESIKESLAEAFPGRYWVKAEISSWSPRASGHCYLSLSQSKAGKQVAESRAIIWKWHFPQLKGFFEQATGQVLKAGITVLVRVQVSYSELYGVSLFIDQIDPAFTLGEKALERKRSIERLTSGGYMELQKELALPDIPYRLAVISSPTAAGYGDFCKHLLENPEGYAFHVQLYEALMQGEQAPASIMEALEAAAGSACDAILILRGGGSELDLSCFDDYSLSVSIATCPVPVITAIGHQRDVHIADMVANTSVKTPTALADLFLEAYRLQDSRLDRLQRRVGDAVQQRFAGLERVLSQLQGRIRLGLGRKLSARENALVRSQGRISRGLLHKFSEVARLKDSAAHRLQFAASARLSQEYSALALREARIKATDPRNILSLGYVLVTGKDHQVLKTVEKVAVGDCIGVRFNDGSLSAKVEEIYSEKLDNNKVHIA